MGTIFVDKLDPQSGTSLEIGSSGDTITIPSGVQLQIMERKQGLVVLITLQLFKHII